MLLIGVHAKDHIRLVQSLRQALPDLLMTLITEAAELTPALTQGDLALIIANDQLPWADGLTILRSVRSHAPDCPVLLFSAAGTIERAVEVIKAGASDYFALTPEYETRLVAAARLALETPRQPGSSSPDELQARTQSRDVESILASEERYRNLFENANDAMVTFSMDGVVTSVNRGLEAMLGWSREELIGQHYRKFVPPNSAAIGEERTRRFLAGEHLPSIFEAEQLHKDGSLVPVEVRTRAIRDKHGAPIGFQGIYRDISARKALERQRADFLAMLTHDIKNPLGVILGYSEMLIEMMHDQGRTEESALVEKLKSCALTVHALVNNQLDLSRIETGAVTLVSAPLELGSLLMRVGKHYEAEAQRRQLSLRFHLQDAPILVLGDSVALERVFTNLIQNAVKFTPAAGQITLSLTRQETLTVATVADTGPGIAPEDLPILFEKYQRAKANVAQEGVGLGLFIAKRLVEAHNGHIGVLSVLGQGTSFHVTLPALSL